MAIPRSPEDLQKLIDNQVQESTRLEYKASPALTFPAQRGEFAKDVSAMANSDGGVIIYGITEEASLPVALDAGVQNATVSRERLEQLIVSNIRPRPEFEIVQIPLTPTTSAFAIAIQRSDRPHQNTIDKKYYKRFNFSAHPMEDYEIEDVRGRRLISEPEIHIGMEAGGHVVYFVLENVSRWPAFDVVVKFPQELSPWLEKKNAPALNRGLRTLPAGRRLRFFYGSYVGLIAPENPFPKQFEVSVSYRLRPDSAAKTETLHVDLMDFLGSQVEESDAKRLGDQIAKGLEELTKRVERLTGLFDQHVGPIATASGVTLSVTALRNLRHLLSGVNHIEKIHPSDVGVVEEVLQVDHALAARIWEFCRWPPPEGSLETIEGMTPALAAEVRDRLIVPER